MKSDEHAKGYPASPGIPQAVIAVAKDASAYIRWMAVPKAEYYSVYRSTSPTSHFSPIASVPESGDLFGRSRTHYTNVGLTNGKVYFYMVRAGIGSKLSADSNVARVTPVAPFPAGSVQWPLHQSNGPNGDGVRHAFGPRNIGSYDFHAGIDIPAPKGTKIYPVMDGIVESIENPPEGQKKIVIRHEDTKKWTQYLHVDHFGEGISKGTKVSKNTVIAYVGNTGAAYDHLHVTYLVKQDTESVSEMFSKNPLEILPYSPPTHLHATWKDNSVEISMPAHQMSVRWIILMSGGKARIADYYDIVSRGDEKRDENDQDHIHIEADKPAKGHPAAELPFTLRLRPATLESYLIDRVLLLDFNGKVLLDSHP